MHCVDAGVCQVLCSSSLSSHQFICRVPERKQIGRSHKACHRQDEHNLSFVLPLPRDSDIANLPYLGCTSQLRYTPLPLPSASSATSPPSAATRPSSNPPTTKYART